MSWLEEMRYDDFERNSTLSLHKLLEIDNGEFVSVYEEAIENKLAIVSDMQNTEYAVRAVTLKESVENTVKVSNYLCKGTFIFAEIMKDGKEGFFTLQLKSAQSKKSSMYCIFADYMSARLFFDRFPDKDSPIRVENTKLKKFSLADFESRMHTNKNEQILLGVVKNSKIYIINEFDIKLAYSIKYKAECLLANMLINTPSSWGLCKFNDFVVSSYSECPNTVKEIIDEPVTDMIKTQLYNKNMILWAGVACLKHKQSGKFAVMIVIDTEDDNAIDIILDDIYKNMYHIVDGYELGYAAVDLLSPYGKFFKNHVKLLVGEITR